MNTSQSSSNVWQIPCPAEAPRQLGRAFIVLLLLISVVTPAWGQPARSSPAFIAGEVIVQFVPEASENQILDVFRRGQFKIKRVILTPVMQSQKHPGVNVVTTELKVEQAIAAVARHPAVAFAEPNWIYRHQAMPGDPGYGSQWGLNGSFGINAEAAWDISIGASSIAVGIVDQGLDFTHLDLRDNIWLNPGDPTENALNEDGNWYWYTYFFGWTVRVDCTDDLHGWDFLNQNNTLYDAFDSPTDLSDGDDHGSHVAGILGATGNNGIGVTGVNWDVSVITSKFLGGGIGTLEDALDAIDYMTFLKTRATSAPNIVAVNASWGGGGYSQAMHDAIIRLANAGVLFVAAAGNGGADQVADDNDLAPFYPANYDTSQGTSTQPAAAYNAVIAVAAIGSGGQMPSWSNYGANTVHLGAPGEAILSTVPTDMYPSGYAYFSGTSMATPHVTGAAALFASANPGATAEQIRDAILASTAPTPSLEGRCVTGGRLDLGALLQGGSTPPPPPTAPAGLTASASDQQVSLAWNPSTGANSYHVKRSLIPGGPYGLIASSVASTDYTDLSVVNGQTYYYVVSALNSGGESEDSGEASATPQAPPPPPASTTLHVGSIVVTTVNAGRGVKKGRAEVLIVDDAGNPVSNAAVSGTFSGSLNESASDTTNSSGLAVLETTASAKGKVAITFCVDGVTHASLTYANGDNSEDCDHN
jgi:subtilisin family serine protease